ncbi:MICAL-like protein 2 isoform X2 [Haliotis rufescens]|uniref:MICAL-like protein 2 isoform X2 n=1 Tax=Haliotis rufescens TaxID=6454 RepID=UPI00201E7D42|nr:MICAL-like protein 2 isoform X2 [Haliotis rufescens]
MAMTKVKGLQMWCQRRVEGYRDVNVVDMTKSWKSGLAFCALIHKFRPDLIDYDSLSKENIFENNQLAFEVAERELAIPALLEAQDMVEIRVPDKLSVVTYVSQYYNYFKDAPQLGGPGVTAKQTSSSSHKRSPAVQPVTGPEIKRFAPANDRNVESATPKRSEEAKKTSTLGDKCVICNNKVYLLERQIENGKLYHRSCFRHSELSPTAKVFKSSLSSPSDDFASKAKVRKTDESPSRAKSNGLKHVETSQNSKSDPTKSLFSNDNRSQPTTASETPSSKPDPLLERLKSRMEVDKKESEVPKYKKNRPLILQTGTKESDDSKKAEPPTPTFNAKKFDKHEFGFLSKNKESNTKAEESKPKETKSGFLTSKTEPSKPTETSSKTDFPVPKSRKFGVKETTKVEKMDTSEPFGAKLKHVSPTPVKKTFEKTNDNSKKPDQVKPKSPGFGKKLLISHAKDKVNTPDSPPPPLPSSQPPSKLTTKYTPHTEAAPPVPSSMPPSFPYKSSNITVNLSTTTTTSSTKPTNKVGILKTTTTTTTTTTTNVPKGITTNVPKGTTTNVPKGITTNVPKGTTSVPKDTTTNAAPLKPPRLYIADVRSESPMDVDEALHKASHPRPGSEPVAVLVNPTDKNPAKEKRVLGGLLASLANVRQSKTDDVTSPTDNSSNKMPPVAKSSTEVKREPNSNRPKSESALPKSKVELSVAKTKVGADVSKKEVSDGKSKSPFSFVSDKIGIFKKDENKESADIISKGEHRSKVTDTSSSRTSAISSSVNLTSGAEKLKMKDTSKSKPEESVPSWKKDTGLKELKSKGNNLLQDSNVSSKGSDNVPSWKKSDYSKTRGSDLLQDSKSEQKSKSEASDQVPSWKQRLHDKDQHKSDLLLDSNAKHKSEPVAGDDTPPWMKALEKRKAEKARPKSVDVLLEESASKQGKSDLVEMRVKPKDEQGSPGLKERAKSASILDDSTAKPTWQLEAQRRLAHNKQAFVDPEKGMVATSDSADSKPVQTAPQKKPRTSHPISDTPIRPPRLKISPKPVSPPPSPTAPVRQLKKISIGDRFEFNPTEKKNKEPPSPLKTPPQRPPAPRGSPSKTVSPGRMSPAIIQKQLDDIDKKLNNLEMRGRDLEDSIRNVDTTDEEDNMMIEWFKLINSKNELVRKEADLIYISKQQDLEDEQEDIDEMLNYLVMIPESKKTKAQKKREADLIEKKLAIVNQRSNIVDSIDEDRIRYKEEDKDIAIMLEEKGFSKGHKAKEEKKPKTSGFILY